MCVWVCVVVKIIVNKHNPSMSHVFKCRKWKSFLINKTATPKSKNEIKKETTKITYTHGKTEMWSTFVIFFLMMIIIFMKMKTFFPFWFFLLCILCIVSRVLSRSKVMFNQVLMENSSYYILILWKCEFAVFACFEFKLLFWGNFCSLKSTFLNKSKCDQCTHILN